MPIVLVRVTPTAKRNSYRVAILVGVLTQGSVLRPQPWAGETQLCQSCRGCVPSYDVVKPQPGLSLGRDEEGFISCGFLSPTPIPYYIYSKSDFSSVLFGYVAHYH